MSNLSVVILAAGKGTRMYSSLPKVLHALAGKPMVQHVLETALSLKTEKIHVVYGFGGELIQKACANYPINWVIQSEQLGTGHAVKQAIPYLDDNDTVLILYADTPLISSATLSTLIAKKPSNGLSLLTVELNDPTGYGRILRKNNNIVGIVEQKDASDAQKQIKEVNTGIFAVNASDLKRWLNQLSDNNAQREFYLTDIIGFAANEGKEIVSVTTGNLDEIQGVNNRLQLASLERAYQKQQAENLLLQGVMLMDPNRFDLRGQLVCGQDVTIDCNVIIEGNVTLGNRVSIGMGCVLKDCHIDDDSIISPYSVIENSQLAQECTVGPFARLRPLSDLKARVHVGNFVEVKKATLGEGTKAGHLSYLGDSIIGKDVNIGAGTITCNYDGANKFQTLIGDNVFVGSDTQFVAPVSVANGATIGAGTTVTQNVGENELVISRVRQKHIPNWPRPTKLKK